MTEVLYNPKIKPEHLARKAIVYLRQSSEKQVRQNKESQLLQYAVAERVRALGWKQVEIINSDLGSSAGLASAQREGFERVLSLVAGHREDLIIVRRSDRARGRDDPVVAIAVRPDEGRADALRGTCNNSNFLVGTHRRPPSSEDRGAKADRAAW